MLPCGVKANATTAVLSGYLDEVYQLCVFDRLRLVGGSLGAPGPWW
ncbi:MAG: hypothetical protein QOE61_430 [Micromonosporaceae bacterium]|nr:hypothetical protein [Micromonosporaceae bacterium]